MSGPKIQHKEERKINNDLKRKIRFYEFLRHEKIKRKNQSKDGRAIVGDTREDDSTSFGHRGAPSGSSFATYRLVTGNTSNSIQYENDPDNIFDGSDYQNTQTPLMPSFRSAPTWPSLKKNSPYHIQQQQMALNKNSGTNPSTRWCCQGDGWSGRTNQMDNQYSGWGNDLYEEDQFGPRNQDTFYGQQCQQQIYGRQMMSEQQGAWSGKQGGSYPNQQQRAGNSINAQYGTGGIGTTNSSSG